MCGKKQRNMVDLDFFMRSVAERLMCWLEIFFLVVGLQTGSTI